MPVYGFPLVHILMVSSLRDFVRLPVSASKGGSISVSSVLTSSAQLNVLFVLHHPVSQYEAGLELDPRVWPLRHPGLCPVFGFYPGPAWSAQVTTSQSEASSGSRWPIRGPGVTRSEEWPRPDIWTPAHMAGSLLSHLITGDTKLVNRISTFTLHNISSLRSCQYSKS